MAGRDQKERLAEIRSQFSVAAGYVTGMGEIKKLPGVLAEDEEVRAGVNGLYGGRTGLLVATNRRLIFVDKKLSGNQVKVHEFPYRELRSIKFETGLVLSKLKMVVWGNEMVIEQVPKAGVRSFCDEVRFLVEAGDAAVPPRARPDSAAEGSEHWSVVTYFLLLALVTFVIGVYAVWLTFAYSAKSDWAEYLEHVLVQHDIPLPIECRELRQDIDGLLVVSYPMTLMANYGGPRAMSLRVIGGCPHLTEHYAATLRRLAAGDARFAEEIKLLE